MLSHFFRQYTKITKTSTFLICLLSSQNNQNNSQKKISYGLNSHYILNDFKNLKYFEALYFLQHECQGTELLGAIKLRTEHIIKYYSHDSLGKIYISFLCASFFHHFYSNKVKKKKQKKVKFVEKLGFTIL